MIMAQAKPSGVRYSDLTIIQKINVKAYAVAANIKLHIDTENWIPMYRAQSNFTHRPYEYASPYRYSIR